MSFETETREKIIESLDSEKSKPSAPLYPSLMDHKNKEPAFSSEPDSIYRLNRCNAILEELKEEKKHYESTYKKYKRLHKTMYTTQLICNSTSVASGGCAVGILASGIGVVAALPLGLVGMISGGIGIMLGTFDQKALKKMKKHSKVVQLCQSIDSQIL